MLGLIHFIHILRVHFLCKIRNLCVIIPGSFLRFLTEIDSVGLDDSPCFSLDLCYNNLAFHPPKVGPFGAFVEHLFDFAKDRLARFVRPSSTMGIFGNIFL